MARALWTDDTGQYETSYFRCLQKDIGNNLVVYDWRLSGDQYNREIKWSYEVHQPQ